VDRKLDVMQKSKVIETTGTGPLSDAQKASGFLKQIFVVVWRKCELEYHRGPLLLKPPPPVYKINCIIISEGTSGR
jgi:hypothetical protein